MNNLGTFSKIGLRRLLAAAAACTLLVACDDPTGPDPDGPPPTVSAVEPATGTVGTELRITGTNFRAGASVQVGELSATGVDVTGETEVFASVPTGVVADMTYDVAVTNSDETTVTFPGRVHAGRADTRFRQRRHQAFGQQRQHGDRRG